MNFVGTLILKDRKFYVTQAQVAKVGSLWTIEIETLDEEFDGERWRPYLYHRGLKLDATRAEDLQGKTVNWSANDETYPHPETGAMYVFGHERVYNCILSFGIIDNGEIKLSWEGTCDVFWDDDFSSDIAFKLDCQAKLGDIQ